MASKLRDVLALDKTENAELREAFIDERILDTEVDTEKIKERVGIIHQQLMICSALAIELVKKEPPVHIAMMDLDSSQLIKKARDQSVIGLAASEWLLKHTHLYNLAKHVIEHEFDRCNLSAKHCCRVCPMKLQSHEELRQHWEAKHKVPANMELMAGETWVAWQADHPFVVGRAEPNGIEVAWIPNGTPLVLRQILDEGGHLPGHLQVRTTKPMCVQVWIKKHNIKRTIKILTEEPLPSDSQPPVPPPLKRHHTAPC